MCAMFLTNDRGSIVIHLLYPLRVPLPYTMYMSLAAKSCHRARRCVSFASFDYAINNRFLNGPAGVMKGICTEITPKMMDAYRFVIVVGDAIYKPNKLPRQGNVL